MSKYTEKFKCEVVERYLRGNVGYKVLGKELRLNPWIIKDWVARHRQHGKAGLTKKHSSYSAEFKLSVLHRMWKERLSARGAMALFDLRGGAGVVISWERLYYEGGFEALKPKKKGRSVMMKPPKPSIPVTTAEDKRTVEDLRQENEYLRAEVAYLKKLKALIQEKKLAEQKKRG